MFYIGDGLEIEYLKIEEKLNLKDLFNKKRFTVKDTPLSYRQVNTLGDADLLNEDRKNKNGWRKFSFKEMVFLLMIRDLKKFGLEHYQLKELSNYFLNNDNDYISDLSLGCVFRQVEILINVDYEGRIDILDPNFYILMGMKQPHITLTLNNYVNELLQQIGKESLPIIYSFKDAFYNRKVLPKEQEIIKLINDKAYSSVTVKKKDGESYIIHATRTKIEKDGLTEKELLKILKEKDYQDVSIVKRDGKIVSHLIKETIKL